MAVIGFAGCSVAQDHGDVQLVAFPTRMNILYRGIDNPVDVAVPGVKCEDLKVSISQGSLEGNGCAYMIHPGDKRETSITMEAKWVGADGKHSSSVEFRVKDIPLPQACFAGACSYLDTITVRYAAAAQGVVARLEGLGFDYRMDVVHYRLQVLRDCTEAFSGTTEGPELSVIMKSFLQHLESDDQLRFSEIRVKFPDSRESEIASLRLIVR